MRHLIILLSVFLMVACSPEPIKATITQSVRNTETNPDSDAEANAFPSPAADSGVVTGRIIVESSGAPLVGVVVYLGEILPLDPGEEYLVTLEEQASPHASIDENGRFIITDIPPGDYPIIVWTPMRSQVLADPDGELEFSVSVQAGEVIDIGVFAVDWR
jgi:hypothetical protein